MKQYFESYKEAREFMETVKVLDYGIKTVNGQKTYWVLYEKIKPATDMLLVKQTSKLSKT